MPENKIKKFELSPNDLKIKNSLKKDFLEIEMKAISTANPNRNGSHFTKQSLEKAISTFQNKPVLGAFSVEKDDFRGHESELKYDPELEQMFYDYTDSTSEIPLGMIRSDDKIYIEKDEEDGLYWIHFTCCLWVKYNYKQIKRLLKSKNGHKKISVEIEVNNSYFDEDGTEVITDFTFDGVTILGDYLETGIADAELTILDMINTSLFQKKQKCLCYAYDALNNSFSEDNVPEDCNENEKEITMDQEGGNKEMLTSMAKKQLLESVLVDYMKEQEDENCFSWVCDFDDNNVYFCVNSKYYSAPYSFSYSEDNEEAETKVDINFDEKKQVIQSWANFSAEGEDKEQENKQCESCDKNMKDENNPEKKQDGENKEFESCSKENESQDNTKTCNSCDKENMDYGTCENKENESCENKEEESCAKENAEKHYDNDSDGNDDDDDDNDDDSEDNKDEFVIIDGENFTAEQILEKYNALKNQYEDLANKEKEREMEEMASSAYEMVKKEERLSDEGRTFVNNKIKENYKNYSSIDELKDFTVTQIAMAFYNGYVVSKKEENTKDFCLDFVNNENNENKPETSVDKLKNARNKLKNI